MRRQSKESVSGVMDFVRGSISSTLDATEKMLFHGCKIPQPARLNSQEATPYSCMLQVPTPEGHRQGRAGQGGAGTAASSLASLVTQSCLSEEAEKPLVAFSLMAGSPCLGWLRLVGRHGLNLKHLPEDCFGHGGVHS